jgi:hypothetical protein
MDSSLGDGVVDRLATVGAFDRDSVPIRGHNRVRPDPVEVLLTHDKGWW